MPKNFLLSSPRVAKPEPFIEEEPSPLPPVNDHIFPRVKDIPVEEDDESDGGDFAVEDKPKVPNLLRAVLFIELTCVHLDPK